MISKVVEATEFNLHTSLYFLLQENIFKYDLVSLDEMIENLHSNYYL